MPPQNENWKELKELFEEEFFGRFVDSGVSDRLSNKIADFWLSHMYVHEQRVREEIAKEIEEQQKDCPNHNEDNPVECYGYEEQRNQALTLSASIARGK